MITYSQTYTNKHTFFWLMFVLIIGTNFLGVEPIANLVNKNTKPIILVKCIIFLFFAFKTYNPKNKIDKWLLYLWLTFALNKLSSVYFSGQAITEVPFQGYFIYDFGFYYIIAYIKPSIRQIEKAIKYLGIAAIIIYFVQYSLLPRPIVETLTSGWRANNAGEFDIQRFSITGEAFIILLGLYSLNKYFSTRKPVNIFIVLAVLSYTILHGYRSIMLAYLIASVFIYIKLNGLKFNKTTISLFILLLTFIILLSNTSIFNDVLTIISEKNQNQSSDSLTELDRVVELQYFYENIQKPWGWIFGAGFIGKNFTDDSLFLNWVDLGFIGLSFMGGILLTICWLRLLILNLRHIQFEYVYISAFFIYIILSTLTLNVAFADKAIIVQVLGIYGFYKIYKLNKSN